MLISWMTKASCLRSLDGLSHKPQLAFLCAENTGLTLFCSFFRYWRLSLQYGLSDFSCSDKTSDCLSQRCEVPKWGAKYFEALEKTSRDYHPDYVEMDVQEQKMVIS